MLRWFVIGAVLGPVLLVTLGFFVSNPSALWWVAGVLAVVAALFVVAVRPDPARWKRINDAAVAKALAEETARRRGGGGEC